MRGLRFTRRYPSVCQTSEGKETVGRREIRGPRVVRKLEESGPGVLSDGSRKTMGTLLGRNRGLMYGS